MGKRRAAREAAFQILYSSHFTGLEVRAAADLVGAIESEHRHRADDFAAALLANYAEHAPDVDAALQAAATNWALDRIAPADLAALRLGAAELLFAPEVPPRVAISEYIDIARKYGDDDSPKFVNGVLDRVAKTGGRI